MKMEKRMNQRSDWRPFLIFMALVWLGLLSFYPFQVAALQNLASEGTVELPFSAALMGLLSLLPTYLMSCAALLAGHFLANRVGLKSLIYDRFRQGQLSLEGRTGKSFLLAASWGMGLGVLFVGFDVWARSSLTFLGETQPSFAGLALGILYGGIVEEVLMRWGLMTVLVYFFTRKGKKRHPAAYWTAILIATLLFALGHYPATHALTEMTPLVWVRMLLLNGAGGAVYGWFYWKHHLEAAVVAHMLTHIGMFLASMLLVTLGVL